MSDGLPGTTPSALCLVPRPGGGLHDSRLCDHYSKLLLPTARVLLCVFPPSRYEDDGVREQLEESGMITRMMAHRQTQSSGEPNRGLWVAYVSDR